MRPSHFLPRALLAPLALALACGCAASPPRDPSGASLPTSAFDAPGRRTPSATTLETTARVLAGRGDDAQCERVLRQLVTEHSRSAWGYNELAALYVRNDRPDLAFAILERGSAQCPEDVVLLNNLGLLHLLEGRADEALARFEAAASLAPRDARVVCNQALALGLAGDYDRSYSLYKSALGRRAADLNVGHLAAAKGNEDRTAEELLLSESR